MHRPTKDLTPDRQSRPWNGFIWSLSGKLLDNRQMAQELAEQMLHIEACIKMLDPTYNLAPYHGEASEGQRLVQARHSI